MSAWIVQREHIDVLVSAGIALKVIDPDKADEVGRMLWTENVKSIHYRYPDTEENDADYPGPLDFKKAHAEEYTYTPRAVEDMAYVHRQLHCYDYQTCEHETYYESAARSLYELMIAAIEQMLGKKDDEIKGDYTWGVLLKDDGSLWISYTEYRARLDA